MAVPVAQAVLLTHRLPTELIHTVSYLSRAGRPHLEQYNAD